MAPRKPSKKHAPRKPKGRPRGKRAAGRTRPLRIQWKLALPHSGASKGPDARRFFKVETLANATERLIKENDSFITPAILQVLGPAPLVALTFELVHENHYRLTFRLRATNAKRRQGTFGFVAAKNADEMSAILETEHEHLRGLHQRAPRQVLRPFRGGHVYLPDRYRRTAHDRDLYAFTTLWPGGHHPLGIGRNRLFLANPQTPQGFSHAQTEGLKRQIVEIMARTYNPGKRAALDVSDMGPGDFAVTKPRTRLPRIMLMACRRLRLRMTPAKLVHEIVGAELDYQGRSIPLAPQDPAVLLQGLADGAGKANARIWLSQYREAVARGKLPEQDTFPLQALDELGIS